MYLTPENPWVFIDKTNADDFLKEVLKLGKPTEVSIAQAAKITGVDASNISRVCNGTRKHVKNKIFKFKEEQ